jgi:hypothetical protein
MKEKIKDIIVRALKTFVQGFLGALAISIPTDLDITKSVLIGGVAGGISAVMNLIINLLSKEEE